MSTQGKKGPGKFTTFLTNIGGWIADAFLLHIYVLFGTIKGGVILGLFPALTAGVKVLLSWILDPYAKHENFKVFHQSWQKNFKLANLVGYTVAVLYTFLGIDWYVNKTHIESVGLGYALIAVMVGVVFLTSYIFTIMSSFDVSYKETLKQSFFLSLATPMHTLAGLFGLFAVYHIIYAFPFIGVFFGFTLFLLPLAWFNHTGFNRVEQYKRDNL